MNLQKTLKKQVQITGLGLHTGENVCMRFCPAKEDSGIVFRRHDGPSVLEIPADACFVQDTSRSTNIGIDEKRIYTVEHVLSALRACNIDNLFIDIFGNEPPAGDGSALPYLKMIDEAGVCEQLKARSIFELKQAIYYSDADVHLVAIPYDGFKYSYTLHYPDSEQLGSQYCSFDLDENCYRREIAPCRTFSLYKEISYLIDQGLIRGGSLENAVVVCEDSILSQGGLRFDNEMARHKLLDLIGDLSLTGIPVKAHFIAICSGHRSNVALAKKLYEHIREEVA